MDHLLSGANLDEGDPILYARYRITTDRRMRRNEKGRASLQGMEPLEEGREGDPANPAYRQAARACRMNPDIVYVHGVNVGAIAMVALTFLVFGGWWRNR